MWVQTSGSWLLIKNLQERLEVLRFGAVCLSADRGFIPLLEAVKTNNTLILYPFKDTPDFETVIYQVCMPGKNRSYYRGAIIVEFENTEQSL